MNIKCGCGFEVSGDSSEDTLPVFEQHNCPTEYEGSHWYESVFSFWGILVILILAAALVKIVTGLDFKP